MDNINKEDKKHLKELCELHDVDYDTLRYIYRLGQIAARSEIVDNCLKKSTK